MADTPPPVTISGGPAASEPPPAPRWSRRTRWALGTVLILLLLGYVGFSLHAASRRRAAAAAVAAAEAEADALRLVVTAAGVAPQAGQPGEAVQDAQVVLTLRNDGPVTVRVLAATLDGTRREVTVQVPSKAAGDVPVTWRIRCAEVGSLPGPRILDLQVRGPAGPHEVHLRLPFVPRRHLPPGDLAQQFHRAAVQVCDVLVPAKG